MMLRYFARPSGETYVMFWPFSRTTPRSGTASPLITRSAVDLPAPFVPSSATVSPFWTSKSTPKSTWTGPYEKSMLASWRSGTGVFGDEALLVLVLLLEQLLDDERQVVADEARAVHQQRAADDRGGHAEEDHGAAHPDGVGEEARHEPTHEPADEEDVQRRHRGAHAAQAIGHDRLQHRARPWRTPTR